MMPYAEVIGDPIAQSKSPALHRFWLDQLGITADYRSVRVPAAELGSYLMGRRHDPDWRGCNATIPHKESIAKLVDQVTPDATLIGAVNCVVRQGERLVGYNSDVDGIAAAIGHIPLEGRCVVLIGAGGAARAMLAYLGSRKPGAVTLLVRDPVKAARLQVVAPEIDLHFLPLAEARDALATATLVVNASPLGMSGASAMPDDLLVAIKANAIGSAYFDMVYQPLRTRFLEAAATGGAETIDGLTMLIGQARQAFRLFFGKDASPDDEPVRALLTSIPSPDARNA
jgi:shikimate dehydrogenase